MSGAVRVKICGLRDEAIVDHAIAAGADAIGLNLVEGSPRAIALPRARQLAAHVAGRALVVAVVVNPSPTELGRLLGEARFDFLQLHGDERLPSDARTLARLWKAVRLQSADALDAIVALPVASVLVDAASARGLGGTGERADWSLAAALAARRPTWLAGGLTPDNVAGAIAAVHPYGVDVASGVERAPGDPDPDKVAAFVRAAKG